MLLIKQDYLKIFKFKELNDLKSKKVAEYAADLYLEFMDKGYTKLLVWNPSWTLSP